MRMLSKLFRMFKGGGSSAGRRGRTHGGLATRTRTRGGGGIGSMIRRFLR